ncbi:senescence-associated family protein [Actinidia rufa]|uniref:Senescence-associated family protein n=1 Tax=Actinidia rufa TaxID=165716 RepID=A0A7J0FSE8_9ERIC|nr:senescence-associated family protein [Actinidia rufa]
MDSTAPRRPCFTEEDNGLASIADATEAEFSGNYQKHPHPHHPFFLSRPLYYTLSQRRGSVRNLSFSSPVSSPRSGRFFDAEEQKPHFLEACFLCEKPLGDNKDIFMYRGDTPFCSEECRQEQIETDEAKEKERNLSSSMKARRKDRRKSNSTSPNKAQDYPFRTGTVAAG